MMGRLRMVQKILGSAHRAHLVARTAYSVYPDPFAHVSRQCTRLKMSQTIVPRKMTLILDLDETLVHSSPRPLAQYQWKIHVPGEKQGNIFYVAVRPHTKLFLETVSRWYEVVVFTASMQHYADKVIDLLDPHDIVARRLFRSSCKVEQGNFIKDLSEVRSDLSQVVIVDNSPVAYSLQAENAVPISTWFNDPDDIALLNILPLLSGLVLLNDVRSILALRTATSAGVAGN